jgi:actin-related protein 2
MFAGLSTRVYKELAAILTKEKYNGDASRVAKTGMKVNDPPRRKHAVFIGASFVAANAADS